MNTTFHCSTQNQKMELSSLFGFLFGFLLSVIVTVIVLLIGFPCFHRHNKVSTNNKSNIKVEDDETTRWVNILLGGTYEMIDLQKELPVILQKSFDESFKPDPNNYIQKITVIKTEISKEAPEFQSVHTTQDVDGSATFLFGLKYNAEILIDMDIECYIPLLGVKAIGAIAKVTKINGFVNVFVPYEHGPIIVSFKDGTEIDINVDLRFGTTEIGTSSLGCVWSKIESFIVYILKHIPIRIDLPWEKKDEGEIAERGLELDNEANQEMPVSKSQIENKENNDINQEEPAEKEANQDMLVSKLQIETKENNYTNQEEPVEKEANQDMLVSKSQIEDKENNDINQEEPVEKEANQDMLVSKLQIETKEKNDINIEETSDHTQVKPENEKGKDITVETTKEKLQIEAKESKEKEINYKGTVSQVDTPNSTILTTTETISMKAKQETELSLSSTTTTTTTQIKTTE